MAVAAVLVLAMAGLVARTAWLQLLHTDFYQRQGDARFLRAIPLPASRGAILDRNGEPLAVSTPVPSIWAHPQDLLTLLDLLPPLARALTTDDEPRTHHFCKRGT